MPKVPEKAALLVTAFMLPAAVCSGAAGDEATRTISAVTGPEVAQFTELKDRSEKHLSPDVAFALRALAQARVEEDCKDEFDLLWRYQVLDSEASRKISGGFVDTTCFASFHAGLLLDMMAARFFDTSDAELLSLMNALYVFRLRTLLLLSRDDEALALVKEAPHHPTIVNDQGYDETQCRQSDERVNGIRSVVQEFSSVLPSVRKVEMLFTASDMQAICLLLQDRVGEAVDLWSRFMAVHSVETGGRIHFEAGLKRVRVDVFCLKDGAGVDRIGALLKSFLSWRAGRELSEEDLRLEMRMRMTLGAAQVLRGRAGTAPFEANMAILEKLPTILGNPAYSEVVRHRITTYRKKPPVPCVQQYKY